MPIYSQYEKHSWRKPRFAELTEDKILNNMKYKTYQIGSFETLYRQSAEGSFYWCRFKGKWEKSFDPNPLSYCPFISSAEASKRFPAAFKVKLP